MLIKAQEFRKIVEEQLRIENSLPNHFADTLVAHMDRLEISVEMLSEQSLISVKTINRMRSWRNHSPLLDTVVAVSIGLKLRPRLSDDLLKKAGYILKNTYKHICYQELLHSHYQKTIHECNCFLILCDLAPLARE